MSKRYRKLHARVRKSKQQSSPAIYITAIGVFGFILLVLLAKVYLGRETIRMGMQWEEKKHELQMLVQETENLRLKREQYMRGDYIRARAAELGLRPPLPGQVRLMPGPSAATDDPEDLVTRN